MKKENKLPRHVYANPVKESQTLLCPLHYSRELTSSLSTTGYPGIVLNQNLWVLY